MRVSILLTILLVNTVRSVNPLTGNVEVMSGNGEVMSGNGAMGMGYNLANRVAYGNGQVLGGGDGLAYGNGQLVSGGGLNGNGLLLNREGLALGNGGNERIVSSQRLAIKPRYITERINRKPRVVTETVVTPVYEKTVNQPRIERTRVELNANFQRQADVVRNNRRVEDVKNTNASRTQNVDVAGDIVEMRPMTRPALLVRRENVRFAPSEAENHNEAPRTFPVRQTASVVQRNANRPGDVTNNRLLIQPVFEKTKVNVELQRGEDRVVNHPARTLPLDARTRTRVQNVEVAGDQINNQRVVRPSVTREEVTVRFAPSQAVTETREPIMRPTIRSREVRRKFYNLEYKVPVERTVRVRVPNYIKVNDYRTVHVPVDEQGNEINVAAGGYRVLGGAALDNLALAKAQGSWNLSGANQLTGDASAEYMNASLGTNANAVSVADLLDADDTLAEAAMQTGNLQFAAGIEAGADLLSAAAAQNAQAAAMAASARFASLNRMGGAYMIGASKYNHAAYN